MTKRSEFAKYNREKETLELAGMPIVIWKDDEYRASRITINLDTDNINMTGEVSGTIKSDTKESAPIKPEENPKETIVE
jgi:lipopolysaccharide export system protein LptA